MIPILFESGTTEYNTNGLGRLVDCIRCVVTEERNGIYECEFDYPITGKLFPEIVLGRIISCTHDEAGDEQPFIIYRRTIPDLRGVVTFYAHHISYMLNDIVVKPYTAGSVALALQKIKTESANANPFNFWTDKTTTATMKSQVPRNARAMLGGEENSILDVYGGGEYKFDKFTVNLYASRGIDSGVEIYYGKNLKELSQDIDNSGTYNAIVPYWADTEGNVSMLPEVIISYAGTGERIDAAPMDLSNEFETIPTAAQLRSAARNKYESGDSWLPTENIKVDFVQLWQTEEYKKYAALQRVSLCDTVSVIYLDAGIERIKQKVIRVVYNVLLERYDSIELGTLQTSLGEAIKQNVLETVPTTSMMEEAIQYATEMIRGGLGGYVVMTPGENGYPQEILIMDTPDVNTAVNVWRFNRGGLGHSHSGYQGPYSDIALTADGRINATMITTGILNASIIRAGTLQDVNGNVTWNLATGILNMTRGSINMGSGNFTVNDSGYLHAEYGEIGPFEIGTYNLLYNTNSAYAIFGYDQIKFLQNAAYSSPTLENRSGTSLGFRGIEFYEGNRSTTWENIPIVAEISQGRWDGNSKITMMFEIKGTTMFGLYQSSDYPIDAHQNAYFRKNLTVSGTKNRRVKTDNYSDRLLYCYETPTPLFGDIGEAVLDEEGICYVDLDDIFTETIAEQVECQVFLQKEGEGDCWIAEKTPRYFIIQGTPNLKVAWELKAKQKDYETYRLEPSERNLEEYANYDDPLAEADTYITEQEELLYG